MAAVVLPVPHRTQRTNGECMAPIPVPHGDFELAWLERDEFYAVLTLKE